MAMHGCHAVLSGLCNYFVIQCTVFYMKLYCYSWLIAVLVYTIVKYVRANKSVLFVNTIYVSLCIALLAQPMCILTFCIGINTLF